MAFLQLQEQVDQATLVARRTVSAECLGVRREIVDLGLFGIKGKWMLLCKELNSNDSYVIAKKSNSNEQHLLVGRENSWLWRLVPDRVQNPVGQRRQEAPLPYACSQKSSLNPIVNRQRLHSVRPNVPNRLQSQRPRLCRRLL
uniref:Uncharacterized protein n=1 Tax=Sphaerodactylus townsendi TaxID=933632 RepID=A0ACB8F7V3_9SAUR